MKNVTPEMMDEVVDMSHDLYDPILQMGEEKERRFRLSSNTNMDR